MALWKDFFQVVAKMVFLGGTVIKFYFTDCETKTKAIFY